MQSIAKGERQHPWRPSAKGDMAVALLRTPVKAIAKALPLLSASALLSLPTALLALWLGWPWWWSVVVCLTVGGAAALLTAQRSVLLRQKFAWRLIVVLAWLPCGLLFVTSELGRRPMVAGIGTISALIVFAFIVEFRRVRIESPRRIGSMGTMGILGLATLHAIQAMTLMEFDVDYSNLKIIETLADRGYATVSQARYASELMRSRYVWFDRLANRDLHFSGDPASVVQRMRGAKDRWSHVVGIKEDLESRTGRYYSSGLILKRETPDRWLVWDIQPGSPAASRQLGRGDTVLSIDNRPPENWLSEEKKGSASPNPLNVHIRGRSGDERVVSLPTEPYRIASVTAAKRLSLANGRQAAYVVFREFLADSPQAMKKALDGLTAEGVSELIVDMRFNPGGDILSVAPVAQALAGSRVAGLPAYTMQMNDADGAVHKEPIAYSAQIDPQLPGFDRVVFLTSSKTASAAEWLIWTLGRYVPVVTIGDTTYGKPYAMTLRIYGDMAYSVIDVALQDDAGAAPFVDGIVPSCAVAEGIAHPLHPLGDPQEPLLKAALDYLENGHCAV